MGTLIAWIIGKTGWSEEAARAVATLVIIAIIAAACVALVVAYNHHVINRYTAQQVTKAAPALDQAATERANDAIANNQTEQEMHNAIAAEPDQPIAPTTRALSCERLRRARISSPACS